MFLVTKKIINNLTMKVIFRGFRFYFVYINHLQVLHL